MSGAVALELTHVLYNDESLLSQGLALATLSPILLMASYASLVVQTRELTIITMWAGQLTCEALNYVLKHLIKEERPKSLVGTGYGFPSSHSQYMGYFATFLVCHFYFKHRFGSTGLWIIDQLWRTAVYIGIIVWAAVVAYSRYHLGYHSPSQIIWGLSIGIVYAATLYIIAELIPTRQPLSTLGNFRAFILDNPVSTWLRIRDGWAIWADGGRESEWKRWNAEWTKRKISASKKRQ